MSTERTNVHQQPLSSRANLIDRVNKNGEQIYEDLKMILTRLENQFEEVEQVRDGVFTCCLIAKRDLRRLRRLLYITRWRMQKHYLYILDDPYLDERAGGSIDATTVGV